MAGFADDFKALTGYEPLSWQTRLYEEWFAQGKVPSTCTLPTGLGKTSVIPIWLIALAHSASEGGQERRLPRRLVYIVNRRTVVDQATDIVGQMRERLLKPNDSGWSGQATVLRSLADGLRQLAGARDEELPLAVSTLRGELADNAEWKANPARPAIIIGTIDMIGSKLLFSGYGDGRYGRAHHAGLVGQDALIVHDEAHLTPAFSRLLRAIEREQQREFARKGHQNGSTRPIRVMELSATTRLSDAGAGCGVSAVFGVQDADGKDSVVRQRLTATKRLTLLEADEVAKVIAEAALQHEDAGCRVLVYVRSPKAAGDVQEAITKGVTEKAKKAGSGVRKEDARNRVGLLTGTIRGYERDLLADSELFRQFKADVGRRPQLAQTLYLVSTSAGEVGVDLDADHLVCDLTTLDSMIQRFGRVNRLGVDKDGRPRVAKISVIRAATDDKDPLQEQLQKTAEILRRLPPTDGTYDASPEALAAVLKSGDVQAAFAPSPQTRASSDILFDHWSLTSVAGDMPGRLPVAEYLHGVADWEPPETFVAWRNEVRLLADAKVDAETLAEWFEACPILAHERLRDRTDSVRKSLGALLAAHQKRELKDTSADLPVVVLSERGQAELKQLNELVRKKLNGRDPLAYATLVLPVEAGGLNERGMLDPKMTGPRGRLDVAEETAGGRPRRRERRLVVRDAEGERPKLLSTGGEPDGASGHLRERHRVKLKEPPECEEDEGQTEELVLLAEPQQAAADSPEQARFRESLSCHLERAARGVREIVQALGLPKNLREAMELAARWHDRGKDRPIWQRYARNRDFNQPLAKSSQYGHGRELGGYRHEFGSLLEAMADPEIAKHPERDLILHLIAAHHGWARPYFEMRAGDHEGPRDPATGNRRRPTTCKNEQVAIEAVQRFGRLQQRFGRWGLAWLESLLRCADAMASQV